MQKPVASKTATGFSLLFIFGQISQRIFTTLFHEIINRNILLPCDPLQLIQEFLRKTKGLIYHILTLLHYKHAIPPNSVDTVLPASKTVLVIYCTFSQNVLQKWIFL